MSMELVSMELVSMELVSMELMSMDADFNSARSRRIKMNEGRNIPMSSAKELFFIASRDRKCTESAKVRIISELNVFFVRAFINVWSFYRFASAIL